MNETNGSVYGKFLFSKNIYDEKRVVYAVREKSDSPLLNGWTLYSCDDDDEYKANPDNYETVEVFIVKVYARQLIDIFNAPFGTKIQFLYTEQSLGKYKFSGFYDMNKNRETDVDEIIGTYKDKMTDEPQKLMNSYIRPYDDYLEGECPVCGKTYVGWIKQFRCEKCHQLLGF